MPSLVGLSRTKHLILTGRPVGAAEALQMGLANRVVPRGSARAAAEELARELAALPQICLRGDRLSAYESLDLPLSEALLNELRHGMRSLAAGESAAGARKFAAGSGRHGASSTGE
jgi:enoyl-CoA hydratase